MGDGIAAGGAKLPMGTFSPSDLVRVSCLFIYDLFHVPPKATFDIHFRKFA